MRTTVLFGDYELTIDDKNRLLVPAEVRRSMDVERDGEAFFITVGENGRPWLYAERRYETFVSELRSELAPDEDRLAWDQLLFAMASKVEWDKQGRILVPEKYRTRTRLNREVTMIGMRDHLELWNRDDWHLRMATLEAQRAEIFARQRQLRESTTAPRAAQIVVPVEVAGTMPA